MKKILITFIFITFPLFVLAQLSGNGTFANPYKGTLISDVTWSFDVYIGGDILTSAYRLTIDPGVKVIFVTDSADIKIRDTGRLIADGTPSSQIRFTADDNNNGIYGEPGEIWGHISFESSTGNSIIDNCIIEYGYKNGSTIDGYGGGIHINSNNVSVSYCTIRNNYALWGGGIFINQNRNPAINNCFVYNNQSLHGGGGIYCWTGSSSIITNCIFDNNHCLETVTAYYTGGGLAAQTGCAIKVINCTFVRNTSARPEGQGLLLHSCPNSRIINSIFWGTPAKQIYCYVTSANVIINCAYRGITYTTGSPVNPVILNATNTAPDGPNFTATDGSDWSILYESPCRDKGVDSYPGVTIPALDYTGNIRSKTTDIGAYEVRYSEWKTTAATTDWNNAANWFGGVPASTYSYVIIPTGATNYPTGSSPNFTLGANRFMTLNPGAKATVGTFTNNGIVTLKADATGFSSLIVSSHSGNNVTLELFLSGGGDIDNDNFKWHYISTPITSLPVNIFAPTATLDLAQFIESRPLFSLIEGWVAYDGYQYGSGTMGGPTFSTLTPGKGYNFWDSADNTFTFSGQLNFSDVPMALQFSGSATMNGFNLLGNPFSSGLSWDDIVNNLYFTYPANTSKSLYFTRNNVQCTYAGGVGVPGDVTGIIPPMQGFFTKTNSSGNTITLPAAARTHSNIHARYKGKTIIPLVRLSIFEDTVSKDETVVRFDEQAKSELDNDFDAVKMFISSTRTQIWSSIGGVNYAINGLPFPDTLMEVPVTVNITDGTIPHTIKATQIQGLDKYDVFLFDNVINDSVNLGLNPDVIFSASKGTITGRFILKFYLKTGIENPVITRKKFNIYPAYSQINIQTLADEWDGKTGSVRVYDITGKTVSNLQNTEFWKNSITQVEAPASKGIYIVELRSGMMRYVGKVIIR